ncbi:universal stress protein [Peptoniphilus obesi]|uniref:universal stress protein n=1 Tax=Peptoniphilus obesi TaxID=1472765 RepID=UPI0004B09B5B|nr:universal stress protein [Peptoniphilus obesi]
MKILVPIDGSKASKRAIEEAKLIGKKFEAELIAFTVIPETTIFEQFPTNFPYALEVSEANTEHAELVLSDIEKLLKDYPYKTETLYKTGDPASEIVEFAKEKEINLIIMGNRGLGAFSRTLLGSVSSKVINHSSISVLLVKGDKNILDK